jgi:DNA processing protein
MDVPSPSPPLDVEELHALIALTMVPGVGPGRVRALLARFGSARRVWDVGEDQLATVEGIGPQTAGAIAVFDCLVAAHRQIERAERVGAEPVTLWDERYPRLLRQIYDPPPLLWVRGSLTPADDRAVAIVGTRRASEYGRRAAERFAEELVGHGFTIVSGLAYGIDVHAHRAAVRAGGRTIAVLGSGVDNIYPSRHGALVEEIERGRGAVISEFPLGAKPDAPNFPRRNRLISGLALGTLVAEARATGGALLTAWMATEQNRAVFAVPSGVFGAAGEGANQLIRKGYASLVTNVEELLSEIEPQIEADAREGGDRPPASPRAVALPDMTAPERALFESLSNEPLALDLVCDRTGLDASTALVYLLSLEFKGLVRQMAGKQFYRA